MKEKIFNIIQIGDKSNRISRAFDIFITFTIICNIIVTFLETFDQLTSFGGLFTMLEHASVLIFCIEYALRIWTADYLYPEKTPGRARFCFLISFDGVVDLLTIIPVFFLSLIPSPKFCPVRRVLPIITKVYRSKTSLFPSYVLNLSVVI